MEKRTVKIQLEIEILTNKDNVKILNALKRGIYVGLDTEGRYIARPSDVNVEVTSYQDDVKEDTTNSIRDALVWWEKFSLNPLIGMIKRGELTKKYFGNLRIISSLSDNEINIIYKNEINN